MATTVYARNRSRICGLTDLNSQKIALRPNDLDSLVMWIKGNGSRIYKTGTTPVVDNDTVATWGDDSAYNYDFGQGSSGNRPTYKTNILNGFPIVRFNGTSNTMSSAFNASDDISFYVVIIPSSTSPIGIFDSAPNNASTFRNYNSGQWEWQNAQPQFNLSLANTNPVLIEFIAERYQGANQRKVAYYRNGILISTNTGAQGSMTWLNPAIGSINGGSAGWFTGDIAELIIFAGAQQTASRKAVETYLNTKYALW